MTLVLHVLLRFGLAWIVLVSLAQLTLVVSAGVELRRLRQRDRYQLWRRVMSAPMIPKVSVLVPAYREELSVVDTVSSLLAMSYPDLEIVVVNDGSPDETLDRLVDHFDCRSVHPIFQKVVPCADVRAIYRSTREPRLVVVDKFNGGKADALNAGLNVASGRLVCAIDADTIVSPDALQQLVAPFMYRDDTAAAGGTVRLVNDSVLRRGRITRLEVPRKILPGIQIVEYIRAFTIGRLGWNPLGGNLIVSGAFGVFRRDLVLEAGGYERPTVGEDMELIVRLRRLGYERGEPVWIEMLPDPVAWTEAPESLRVLARQRNRWQRGLTDVLNRHRIMIGNPKYRLAGMLSMPYYLVVEFMAPVIEFFGLVLLAVGLAVGWYEPAVLWWVAAAYGLGVAVTIAAVWLDSQAFGVYPDARQRLRLIGLAVLEQVVYRPMTLVWRLWGMIDFFDGKTSWGEQVRKGFTTEEPASTAA